MPEHSVVLLAEDRDDDVFLIRRAFIQGNIFNPLFVVRDGEEAIAYIKGEGNYSNRSQFPRPDLVLLDLKMPGKDGFEVLKWIRQQPDLNGLIVIVLTSSDELCDFEAAFKLGANSYLIKPDGFERVFDMIMALKAHWLSWAEHNGTSGESVAARRLIFPPRRYHQPWQVCAQALPEEHGCALSVGHSSQLVGGKIV